MSSSNMPECTPELAAANNSGSLYAADVCILVISTVFLAARLYARSLTTAKRGWDEFLLPISWVLLIGLCAIGFISISYAGVGRHVACLPEGPFRMLKLVYVLDWFYVPSNCLSRISVVLLFLRVFVTKASRVACWVVIGLLIGNCVATLIAAQVECVPLEKAWNPELPGQCFNTVLWWKYTNVPNIILDVFILILPVRTVWTLKASAARKTGISFVFLTGGIGIAASSVRTWYFFRPGIFTDGSWYGTGLFAWTIVECGMYFTAACLVGLRPILSGFARYIKVQAESSNWSRRIERYKQLLSGNGTSTAMDDFGSKSYDSRKGSSVNSTLQNVEAENASYFRDGEHQYHRTDKQARSFV